jgi:FolB domain-containing protein
MAHIRIENLRLQAIVGINDWERTTKQDVVINVVIDYDATPAAQSDRIEDAYDYKVITKRMIEVIEASDFFLIETLAQHLLEMVLENPRADAATVRVDKPGALRGADSVSIEVQGCRPE